MGIFSSSIEVKYLGGHPQLPKPRNLTVKKDGDGLVLTGGMFGPTIKIARESIRGLQLGVGHKRSAGKAVAGAVIGGILTGGIGLLAGAAIGGRRKQDNTATLVVEIEDIEYGLELGECNGSKYAQLAKMIG